MLAMLVLCTENSFMQSPAILIPEIMQDVIQCFCIYSHVQAGDKLKEKEEEKKPI